MVAVPLWSGGEVIGVLAITAQKPRAFSEEDEALLSLLANCAVPPIEKARLARLAVTDAQTMAYNSSFLLPGLRQHMERLKGAPASLTLLLMDLDEFKQVNDRFGHAAGDAVLKEFARRVRTTTRERDLIVRRGGDEFVLIMPGTDRESARHVADRIRHEMDEKVIPLPDGSSLKQTVSIGVATWDGCELPEELEKRADEAMYAAKTGGRNEVVVAVRPTDPPRSSNPASAAVGDPAQDLPAVEAPVTWRKKP
jgi:diguanylate cyclase (GGDEF)-like protein